MQGGVGSILRRMPTELIDRITSRAEAPEEARVRPTISLAEVATLTSAVVVGLVALISLVLAELGRQTLVAVVALTAGVVLILAVVAWRSERISVRKDWMGTLPVVVGGGLALVFFFPGFQYGTGDRDPGVYVEIASVIARTHGNSFSDRILADGLLTSIAGSIWPGLWVKPGTSHTIYPQFYHLWPALLATAKEAGGFTGMFNVAPLVGLVAVLLAVITARRIAGLIGAWTVALILPTNMLQVWQAKYPSAEMFGQMLFLGAVLGVVLAVREGWRTAAAIAGLFVTLGYLERPDGVLLVVAAWSVVCALIAFGRFDGRARWFTIGLLVPLPYALYQAYGPSRAYTASNSVPSLAALLSGMVLLAVVAVVAARARDRWSGFVRVFDKRQARHAVGAAYLALCGVLLALAWYRPQLFGADYRRTGTRVVRLYNEISFIRLTWFFSLTGIALMVAGIAYVCFHRWRFDRWLVCLATTGLLTLYCYDTRNSPYLMWSTRRFVTMVVPGMLLLMACGTAGIVLAVRHIARIVHVNERIRLPVTAVAVCALVVGLAVFGASQSWPLRHNDENAGSVEVATELAALSGDHRGVYLFQQVGGCCAAPYLLFGGPMTTIVNQSSALLPSPGPAEVDALQRLVQKYDRQGLPVFYVADGKNAPPVIPGASATRVRELAGALPHWDETFTERPKHRRDYTYDMSVYRLVANRPAPTSGPSENSSGSQ